MNGHFDDEYQSLADLFFEQGQKHALGGSSLAVYRDGREVVNLWRSFWFSRHSRYQSS